MKKLSLFLLVFFSMGMLQAQDSTDTKLWNFGGQGVLTYNQVALANWSAGGSSNMTLIGNLNLYAKYKKGNINWENSLDLAYGFLKENYIFNFDAPITKAEDKIDFNSKFGSKAWNDKFSYTGLLNMRSQFSNGFVNPGDSLFISAFAAPLYIQFSVGLDFKPNDDLTLFLSPISAKITIVNDDRLASEAAFGVNQKDEFGILRPGSKENIRYEFGATFRLNYKKDFNEKFGINTQLDLFSNYLDRPGNIDVRWQFGLMANITEYLVVTLNTDMIYDDDIKLGIVDGEGLPVLGPDGSQKIGPRLQVKEVFGLGLTYKF